jgi:hypothetical protein
MCQNNYNRKKEEKKYQHLNYVEKTQIERWYNIEKRPCSEIAKLLNKSVRTIQREIKRGLTENLTTLLEIKYVYSATVSEQKYRYNMTAKGPNIKLDANYRLVEYIENGIKKESSLFLNGQEYLQQTTFLNGKTKLIENEITKSNLRVYFENKEFIYIKKIDMITFISENELDGVNVYIKRMPNIENHIMDVYGKKESILKFIKKITNVSDKTMLSMISNIQLEEDDYDYNLSFADEKAAIDEEIAIFNLLNEEDK